MVKHRIWSAVLAAVVGAVLPLAGSAQDADGGLRGVVLDVMRDPMPVVSGARVSIVGPSSVWEGRTDAHGRFIAFGLAPGRYELNVEILGLNPWRAIVCVHASEMRFISVTLDGSMRDPSVGAARLIYDRSFRPDASQASSVYNLGAC
ncbi:MAG: carboxypeptidase regulatory-like domain-containing protein [bacterium]|nr:carboxypeptidase regulatory-like domain-containing protein [bacterium]